MHVIAATTTAAVPFITKIMNLLKKVDFKKLVAKVNGGKMQSDTTEEGESAEESEETDGSETTNGSEDGEPTKNALKKMKSADDTEAGDESIVTKAMSWVKDNPTTSVLMGAGALFLIYQAVTVKPKPALSGARKGKKKKGKAKNNPPRTVSGTHNKRHKKSGTNKKFKL